MKRKDLIKGNKLIKALCYTWNNRKGLSNKALIRSNTNKKKYNNFIKKFNKIWS